MLFPRAHVLVLVPLGFFITTMRIPALLVLGLWFVMQFLYSAMTTGQSGGVAYWAHIGGFVAGAILIIPFRNKEFPLFSGPQRQVRRGQRQANVRSQKSRPSKGPWG